tara:strand:- start:514 stop:1350 length:837 start_codon:yes stop_codon:yes gene_type:complete
MSHHLNDTDKASQSIFIHSNDSIITISDAEKIFYFKESITAPAGYRILIGLTNLTLPNSMFNVTSESNSITINDITYSISVGNYTSKDLTTKLNAALTTANVTVSFDDDNNTFSFKLVNGGEINSSTMERQLGLRGQLPQNSIAAGATYIATNVCDLGGSTNIYIRLRNLTMNNLDSRGATSNIVASIVNNTNYGGYIFYVPPEVLYYTITENNISHLDIELTDQEGKILELNGVDYNMTFTIHYIKQRESIIRESMLQRIKSLSEPKLENSEKNNVS